MTIFLILLPYAAFSILMLLTSAKISLFATAAICMTGIASDFWRGRSIKILGAGSAVLFAGLGSYVALVDPNLSSSTVRLSVDAGVFVICLASLAVRHPFTLQYALEMVDAETAKQPGFVQASYMIAAAWTVALLLMMIGNVMMLVVPGLPLWSALLIAFAARYSAAFFTRWYPQYRRTKSIPPGASAGAA